MAKDNRYQYYYIIAALFSTILITAMTLAGRMVPFGLPHTSFEFPAPAGVFIFPVLFALTDITTEVYGFKAAMKIVWMGIICLWIFTTYVFFAMHMPTPANWTQNIAYNNAFSILVRASFSTSLSLLAGIACNSYIMSKAKVAMKGKHYVSRALFSSMFGEAILQIMAVTITYFGTLDFAKAIIPTIVVAYGYKIIFNIVAGSFLTAPIQARLKILEGVDQYDEKDDYKVMSVL